MPLGVQKAITASDAEFDNRDAREPKFFRQCSGVVDAVPIMRTIDSPDF